MLTLFHAPQSRSLIVQWMLEEVGEPYELRVLDLKTGEHKRPEFLAVNPMGKVPALVHDGIVVTESAAICGYLADAFPGAGLAPAIGEPLRGPYLRWLFFGAGALDPAIVDRMLRRRPGRPGALGYGDFDTTVEVVAQAVARKPYLLGEAFSAADVVVGSAMLWGRTIGVIPERPEFEEYAGRLMERPALRRTYAQDAELAATQG